MSTTTTTTRPRSSDSTAQLIEDLAGATPEDAGVILAELPFRKAGRKYLATIPAPAQEAAQEQAVEVQEVHKLTHQDRQADALLRMGFSGPETVAILRDFARNSERSNTWVPQVREIMGMTFREASDACGVVAQKRFIPALVELAG